MLRGVDVNLPGGWELVLVVLVIMVLFGAKRLTVPRALDAHREG